MTVRAWLPIIGALLVPVVIAAGTWGITWQQGQIAEERAQDEALQAYLDQMGTLLLKENLRSSKEDSGVRSLAQARTLTVLRRLGTERKVTVINFLYAASLLNKDDPIIDLYHVDLRDVDLSLPSGDLSNADLRGANMHGANMPEAYLMSADLLGTNLSGANLYNAVLVDARMTVADLRGANMAEANLTDADLSYADLRGANMHGAEGWTPEQLDQAEALEGATMPDGQILKSADNPDGPTFDEWLKSKGSGEDGENTGAS